MTITRAITRGGRRLAALAAAVAAAGLIVPIGYLASAGAAVRSPAGGEPKPSIVLVHGAWADSSSWNAVASRLQHDGYTVYVPPNPLLGLRYDPAFLRDFLSTLSGPVILVGHSYGGAVITNAATGNTNVKALVYIAAFAPARGETSGGILAKFPGSMLTPQNLILRPFPQPDGSTGEDAYINPSVFREAFCADCSARTAAVMAATQRPAALATLSEPSGVPAWKTIPSWYLVASQDHAIPPAAERFMADRMHAHTVQINSSHAAMVSHPGPVADLILSAAQALR